ncbi:MAG: CvpA family protein [Verrucomicrobia bacterium]|nr:CvpA family protein [Cytophagales bacterium]
MKTLDLIILIPLAMGAYRGYRQGLLLEIIAILAFVAGIVLGFKLLGMSLNFIKPYLGESKFLPYIAFSAIFIPISYAVLQIGKMFRKSLRYTILGNFDSWAGAILGTLTAAIGVSCFLLLLDWVKVIPPKDKKDTVIYPAVAKIAPAVVEKIQQWIPSAENLLKEVQKAVQQQQSPNLEKPETEKP